MLFIFSKPTSYRSPGTASPPRTSPACATSSWTRRSARSASSARAASADLQRATSVRSHPAPSLSGRRRFLLPAFQETTPMNGESRASLAAMHGLPKYAWRLRQKRVSAQSPRYAIPDPEQAAVSPAVMKPIAAHPYRTVIGTLSKDESPIFLKNREIFSGRAKRRIRDRICPHSTTISALRRMGD